MDDTLKRVREIIAEGLGREPSEILLDSTFEMQGGDSVDLVEIVMALEEKFDIEIPEDEALRLFAGTIRQVAEGIAKKRA